MKKLKEKFGAFNRRLSAKALCLSAKAIDRLKEDGGDTNFLSILIILAIVLVVAVAFIAFKDQIFDLVNQAFNKFKEALKL